MAMPDLPDEAVEAAAVALWVTSVVDGSPSVGVNVRAALAAAAPHLRAQVLAEVQIALDHLPYGQTISDIAVYLAAFNEAHRTFSAGGDSEE